MKKAFVVLGCAAFLCALVFLFTYASYKPSISSNLQDHPELALADRPDWAKRRSEGDGFAMLVFLHFLNKKPENMVLNPFPGQRNFFATQRQLLANLPQPLESQPYVRVGFVGDLMPISNPGERLAPEILTTLQSMDFVLGNLETPVSQSSPISRFRDSLAQFNVPPSYLNALSINGRPVFQFLSLANNHILDRGDLGVQETMQNVEAKGMLAHGADQKKFALFSSKGIRFGVVAATWGVNPQIFQGETKSPIWYLKGIAPLDKTKIDLAQLRDSLAEMKKASVDFKVAFLHWGFEYETYPDPLIQEIGGELIHAGADLVIGSHPHVLQPFELVQADNHKGLIAYSMGNFVTSMPNPFNRIGLIQELKVWRNADKKVEWSLGASRLTQMTDGDHSQIEFLESKPIKDLAGPADYYKQSLNLPFLQ